MSIYSWAALEPGAELQEYHYAPAPLGPWDGEVEITHCGICHSDIHLIDNDWKMTSYPFVPGHEIIGEVVTLGDRVSHLKRGDRVGIGWQHSACLECGFCRQGEENLCSAQTATCVGRPGGFAHKIRADARFAFRLPKELSSERAAPLLCGGATVYSPFIQHQVKPTWRVAILGIGGLGHLAIQFASRMGCEVTAISSHADKAAEAAQYGAHHFLCSKERSSLQQAFGTFDFILSTTPGEVDWNVYVKLLRPKGILCQVGAINGQVTLPFMEFLSQRKQFCGSNIASRPDMEQMLLFAARHDLGAEIELFPLQQVNEAIQKVRSGAIRYRAVLFN